MKTYYYFTVYFDVLTFDFRTNWRRLAALLWYQTNTNGRPIIDGRLFKREERLSDVIVGPIQTVFINIGYDKDNLYLFLFSFVQITPECHTIILFDDNFCHFKLFIWR